eukprot:SAG22_NODE_699_length_7801_cov_6.003116_3_plen_83_part_00
MAGASDDVSQVLYSALMNKKGLKLKLDIVDTLFLDDFGDPVRAGGREMGRGGARARAWVETASTRSPCRSSFFTAHRESETR